MSYINNSEADTVLVEMHGIRKFFGNVKALDNVNFRVNKGEIAALLGDNGAGKSTLVKILSGLFAADSGTFLFNGKNINPAKFSVTQARKMGIETVYQDRALGLRQSLWRNVFMGRHIINKFGLIDVEQERSITSQILNRLNLGRQLTPDTPAGVLSGGERQGLAIGRAMYFDAELVLLDEPTTALALSEVDKVLAFINELRESGRSAVFITHNIDHAWRVADRFIMLSHGHDAGEWTRDDLTLDELLRHLRYEA